MSTQGDKRIEQSLSEQGRSEQGPSEQGLSEQGDPTQGRLERDQGIADRVAETPSDGEPAASAPPPTDAPRGPGSEGVYFIPDEMVTVERVGAILQSGDDDQRAWLLTHLLTYGQWDHIWELVDVDTVRRLFPRLDLPARLRTAWARTLGIE